MAEINENTPEPEHTKKLTYHSHPKYKKEQFIAALKETRGNVLAASRVIGCGTQTMYAAIHKWESVKKELLLQRNIKTMSRISIAEDNLDDALEGKDWRATQFTLSTLGKDLGYSYRHELSGQNGAPIETTVEDKDSWLARKEAQAQKANMMLTK